MEDTRDNSRYCGIMTREEEMKVVLDNEEGFAGHGYWCHLHVLER